MAILVAVRLDSSDASLETGEMLRDRRPLHTVSGAVASVKAAETSLRSRFWGFVGGPAAEGICLPADDDDDDCSGSGIK